ncbi:MAG: hypothetical protein ABIO86_11830 [Sphingomonas sp.]
MKILICAEGKNDIGCKDRWDDKSKSYVNTHGWMQPMIYKVNDNNNNLIINEIRRQDLTILPKNGKVYQPWPHGHGAKALLAKRYAVSGSYDVVIFMVDADSVAENRWTDISNEIDEGFSKINGDVVCITCIPVSMSESWLLADKESWLLATGYGGDGLPDQPENIWGARNDPAGNHPHRLFARICLDAEVEDSSDLRALLSEHADIIVVANRCPISFAPYLNALQVALVN